MNVACPLCGHVSDNRPHAAREMMFGRRDPFTYLECADCGALTLLDPPVDPSPYYPPDYYSYAGDVSPGGLRARLLRRRARARLTGGDPLGALLLRALGSVPRLDWMAWMDLGFDAAILDVGCGAGELLRKLRADGFTDLSGVDPYLEADLELGEGLRIRRRRLADETRRYDLVMLHHALEHMPDQAEVFAQLRERVRPGGWLLIRVPVADSDAWREYNTDWVQLDAPRHLVLHTRRSLDRLAEAAGFVNRRVLHDSTGFQFWGSEQYRADVPLRDPRSAAVDPAASAFDRNRLAAYERRAADLNAAGRGDQAAFFYRAGGA